MLIEIVEYIELSRAYEYLRDPAAGGMDLFVGTVRDHAGGKEVQKLVFEAYKPMALSEMKKIGEQAAAKWPLCKIVMLHVVGERIIGEPVVVVGVSAAHRAAAFEACRYLIDELKATVPIWKKEFYADSSVWVAAHP